MTGKNRIMIFDPKRRHLRCRVQDGRGCRADDFDSKNRGGRGPAFPRADTLRIVRAGCRRGRHLIGEVAAALALIASVAIILFAEVFPG
jgi:hypothetical protein